MPLTGSFAVVPPGTFTRRRADGTPQTIAITKAVHWQSTPVTAGQYRAYLQAVGNSADPQLEIWDQTWRPGPTFTTANSHGDDIPVVGTSFHDALAFITWLNRRDNRHYRLPTEAEFEYTVRARCSAHTDCTERCLPTRDTTSRAWPQAFLACWSDATRTPDPHGIHGLSGVLWQWCNDWYDRYPDTATITDPTGPATPPPFSHWNGQTLPPGHVIRGGSYSYPPRYSRCANRHFSLHNDRNTNLGFRIVFDA